jgi:hypothetical protein
MGAPQFRVTDIVGAQILVVTSQSRPAPTSTIRARFAYRAGVAIVAGTVIGFEMAAGDAVTAIVGAGIVILTGEGNTVHATFSGVTTLLAITSITVIAVQHLPRLAPHFRIAILDSIARIAVIAEDRGSSCTAPLEADITGSASIAIVTGRSIMGV